MTTAATAAVKTETTAQPAVQPQSAPAGAVSGQEAPQRADKPRIELSTPPCVPLDQITDPEALREDTVVFLRSYDKYMEGQVAGFVRHRAEALVRARVAVPYNPAIHRQTFVSRAIKK